MFIPNILSPLIEGKTTVSIFVNNSLKVRKKEYFIVLPPWAVAGAIGIAGWIPICGSTTVAASVSSPNNPNKLI